MFPTCLLHLLHKKINIFLKLPTLTLITLDDVIYGNSEDVKGSNPDCFNAYRNQWNSSIVLKKWTKEEKYLFCLINLKPLE